MGFALMTSRLVKTIEKRGRRGGGRDTSFQILVKDGKTVRGHTLRRTLGGQITIRRWRAGIFKRQTLSRTPHMVMKKRGRGKLISKK